MLEYHYKGSLIRALQAVYPMYVWNTWRFSNTTPHNTLLSTSRFGKNQYLLFQHLRFVSSIWKWHSVTNEIFRGLYVEFNSKYAPLRAVRERPLEFDVSSTTTGYH